MPPGSPEPPHPEPLPLKPAAPERIDAHQHFWRYDPRVHTFIDERMPQLQRDFLPADLAPLLKSAQLSGCIAVQAPQTLTETRWLLSLAADNPFIRGVVGWVDLRAPDLPQLLADLSAAPRFRGVRHILQDEPASFFEDPALRRGLRTLPSFDLVYDVLVYEPQLPAALALMASLPDVRFVLDHVGKPNLRAPQPALFRTKLRAIAALPNVTCKLSGLVTEAPWDAWSPAALRPFLDIAVECFGPARLLFGSDWPVCTLAASYAEVTELVEDYFRPFSASERAQVFGGTAQRVYGV